MSCRHLTRNARPAPFWRRALCGECHKARKADALIAFALLCRKAEPVPLKGLKHTLTALELPCSSPRPRHQRFALMVRRMRRPAAIIAGGSMALGFAWTRYIDIDPKVSIPYPVMHRPNAFDSFNRAAGLFQDDATVNKMLEQMKKRKNEASKPVPTPPPPGAAQPGTPAMPMMSGGVAGAQAGTPAEEKEREFTREERAELIATNKPALDAVREGLTREYLAPPIRSNETTLPYLAEYRKLARLLRFESDVYAEQSDPGKAAESAIDAIALGIKIQQSSALMGKLTGVACEAIGRSALWDLLPRLGAAESKAAAARLEQLADAKPTTADTLTEERWVVLASTLEIMRKPGWRGGIGSLMGTDNAAVNWAFYLSSLPYSKTRILGSLDRHMLMTIATSSQAYTGPIREELPQDRPVPKLVELLWPGFSQFRFRDLVDDAENRLLATTLALHAYRREHGAYPATLTSLRSDYIRAVPLDPFAANWTLRYRRAGDSYVLWSVGPDATDQDGTAIRNPESQDSMKSTVQSDSYGDIVAGVNRN